MRVPWPGVALVAGALVAASIASGLLLINRYSDDVASPPSAGLSAVIVDQLSLTQPGPDFVSAARRLLDDAGYATEYVAGEQVTVDFYRSLPSLGYDLVILRAHAGITTEVDAATGQKTDEEYVSLFTGEPFESGRYPEEELNRLGKAVYYEGAEPLFGIGPRFVTESMRGDFGGAVVVMMGCDGLRSQVTGQAFLDRGAGAFISWSKPVSAGHTDAATEKLLAHLLLEGLTPAQAVAETAAEVGADPFYGAELRVLTES